MTFVVTDSAMQGTAPCQVHSPDGDSRRGGRTNTLEEFLEADRFVPLVDVVDQLPFSMGELTQWARKGPFASCFEMVRNENAGKTLRLRVNLAQFSQRFEELASQSFEEDSRSGLSSDSVMDDIFNLNEMAELTRKAKYP